MSGSVVFIDVGEPTAQRRRENANRARSWVMKGRRRRQRATVPENSDAKRDASIPMVETDVEAVSFQSQICSPKLLLKSMDYTYADEVSAALMRQSLASKSLRNSSFVVENIPALRGYDKPVTTHFHRLINHVVKTMWPKYWPSQDADQASPLVQLWWPLFVNIPAVFHVFLYAAAVHYDDLKGQTYLSQTREILMHKHEVFKQLQTAVSNGDDLENLDEALVLAMTYLGMENDEYDRDRAQVAPGPFKAPGILCGALWLRHYAHAKDNVHIQAATKLIGLKGGLEQLSTPLAKSISINDLQIAAKYVRRPVFPFWDIPEIVQASKNFDTTTISGQDDDSPSCRGFLPLRSVGLRPEVQELLQRTAKISRKIDIYSKGSLSAANLHLLSYERNRIHHGLLSLSTAVELGLRDHVRDIHECCRIGALLFSTGVLYPLPPLTGAPHRLVLMAKECLETVSLEMCMLGGGKLLVWILALGGIMARDRIERPWFLRRLKAALAMENIKSWQEMKAVMTTFLWLDDACDEAANDLYQDLARPPYL